MTYELLDNLLLESKNIEENIEIDELDKEDFKRLDSRINICMKELSYNIISESDMHKFKKKQLIESLHETDFNEREIDKFIKEVPGINVISMMPLTPDYTKFKKELDFLEDFRKSTYDTVEYCMKTGYILSPRAHVWIFNNFKMRNEFMDIKR